MHANNFILRVHANDYFKFKDFLLYILISIQFALPVFLRNDDILDVLNFSLIKQFQNQKRILLHFINYNDS